MTARIVYNTNYGNTEKVAEQIRLVLDNWYNVELFKSDETEWNPYDCPDVLLIGASSNSFRIPGSMSAFKRSILSSDLKDAEVGAVDARSCTITNKKSF